MFFPAQSELRHFQMWRFSAFCEPASCSSRGGAAVNLIFLAFPRERSVAATARFGDPGCVIEITEERHIAHLKISFGCSAMACKSIQKAIDKFILPFANRLCYKYLCLEIWLIFNQYSSSLKSEENAVYE